MRVKNVGRNSFRQMLFATLVFVSTSCMGQELKSVKTAQDVIDNYVFMMGGIEKLKQLTSVNITGTTNVQGADYPFRIYASDRYFYMNFELGEFGYTMAYDAGKNVGWQKVGSKIADMEEKDIVAFSIVVESMMWKYYYDKDKYGVTYELMENEKVGDKESYVVDFKKGDKLVYTVYFDTVSFDRLKQVTSTNTSIYEDIRELPETKLRMPFRVITNQATLAIKSYEFNSRLEEELTQKPK